jgi:hypothetical protein
MSEIVAVKNMVCQRCVLAVEDTLKRLGIGFDAVHIGEIHLADKITATQSDLLSTSLRAIGLELIDNRMTG